MATPVGFLGRCWTHDYTSRCLYMITITTADRQALLGELRTTSCPPPNGPSVDDLPSTSITRNDVTVTPTAIGKILEQTWLSIPGKFPGIKAFEYQIMPDHFHGILFFETPQDKPLGAIVGFLKAHSTSLCKQAGLLACSPKAGGSPPCSGAGGLPPALWSKGYTDSILLHKGQLHAMREYIKDNPRRLAIKRAHRDLFKVVTSLPFGGGAFMALGNRFLLNAPSFYQIQCSRSITPQAPVASRCCPHQLPRHDNPQTLTT